MSLKIEMLRTFCVVVESGSLSEAANRLGRTQSAVSMTLRQMGEHLEEKLFEGDRKNRLTPTGQRVFEVARKEVSSFDQTVLAIERIARAPGEILRVASVASVAGLILPRAISETLKKHPKLSIDLSDGTSEQVRYRLVNGETDLGIMSHDYGLNSMVRVPLFDDPYGVVCAREHPLALMDRPLSLDQLAQHGVIWNSLCDTITAPEFHEFKKRSQLTIHNTLPLLKYIRSESGVTILPKAASVLLSADLVFRDISHLIASRRVSLFHSEKLEARSDLEYLVDNVKAAANRLSLALSS